jgi:hypothetical protein
MSDVHIEEVDGTTITTVVPTSAPPSDLSVAPPPSEAPAEPAAPDATADQDAGTAPTDGEKKTKYQSRIDRLIAERYEAEARATVEAERRARLEEEIAQLRRSSGGAPSAPAPEPQRGDFPDDDQYIAALVAYRTDQRLRETLPAIDQRIEAIRQEQVRVEALRQYQERVDAVRSELPDYDAVTQVELPVNAVMRDIIWQSPVGPRLAYYLGQHPEECVRLANAPPIQVAKEMGSLEARLSAATTGTATQATRYAAPPPVKPVGGAPTAAASSLWSSTISQAEFERIRNEQERARRSR